MANMEGVKRLVDGAVERGLLHGLHTRCYKDGACVLDHGAGHADAEKQLPLDGDTICRFYSMTKPVVGVAILMLRDEGLLALDDPVSKHVPEWRDGDISVRKDDGTLEKARRPITIVDLLTHTAGLDYGFWPDEVSKTAKYYRELALEIPHAITGHTEAKEPPVRSLQEFCTRLQRVPLSHQPGERFQYSVSIDVLGRVVEAIHGSLRGFFQERIFTPLGMKDTDFGVPEEKLDRFASLFSAKIGGKTPKSVTYELIPGPIGSRDKSTVYLLGGPQSKVHSGGGGLVSTSDDYCKFARMLVTGAAGGVRFLSEQSLADMRADHLGPRGIVKASLAAAYDGFGLTVAVTTDAGRSHGRQHSGKGTHSWGGAANTGFLVDPVNDVVVVITAQLLGYNLTVPTLRAKVMLACYQCLAGEEVDVEAVLAAVGPGEFAG
ncbi:hypothetical protein DIPPA_09642 [Diplonema papillatum]|nr:hypothetical protein DIPPA_09642 [Diplonema papillatum]